MAANGNGQPTDKLTRRRRLIKAFEKKALGHRTWPEKVADAVTENTGSITFLLINLYWFFAWIILNIEVIPGIIPFDPFPFGLLTMIVSLEAIVLAIFVLVSQNRAAKISALRDELQLQVNLIAEEEITKVLEVLSDIRGKVGIRKPDPELEKMLERIDTSYIEQSLQRQMENSNIDYIHIVNPMNVIPGMADIEKNEPEKRERKEKNGKK